MIRCVLTFRFNAIVLSAMFVAYAASPLPALQSRADSREDQPKVQISVEVTEQVVTVAVPIELRLHVLAPQGSVVRLPTFGAQVGSFDILRTDTLEDVPTEQTTELRRWTLRVILETIRTGTARVAAMDVAVTLPGDDEPTIFQSEPREIEVVSVLNASDSPTSFRELKGAVDAPTTTATQSRANWVVVIAVCGVLCGAVAWWWRRRETALSPRDWALAEIRDLRLVSSTDASNPKDTYVKLIDIVSQYFRFEFQASAHQIIDNEENGSRPKWQPFFQRANAIKFAQRPIDADQLRDAFTEARNLITAELSTTELSTTELSTTELSTTDLSSSGPITASPSNVEDHSQPRSAS